MCLQTQQRHSQFVVRNSAEQTLEDWYAHKREYISNYNTHLYLLVTGSEETSQSNESSTQEFIC